MIADKKVACSEKAAKWLFNNSKNVSVINNGIDTSKFVFSNKIREKIRDKYSIDDKALIIGNVGRFSKQKNHSFLIEIFDNILKIEPNAVLFLIGTGNLEDKIREEVNRKNISQNVYFLGRKNNIADYLSAMDIFIMPSLFEGLPLAAVEAQASGMSVFVSNTITREIFLTNTIHSFSLKEDPRTIAKKVLRLGKEKNRQEKSEMVKKAGFDLGDTVINFQSMYRQLIK